MLATKASGMRLIDFAFKTTLPISIIAMGRLATFLAALSG
ncbi:MAG: hypothetical protein ACL7BU_00325 [Candidatus Phlomobacter fragariae]